MIRHITAADDLMTMSGFHCVASALEKGGCDNSTMFKISEVDHTFHLFNEGILSESRGAGYWLWKPYFMLRSLMLADDGDYLIYTDAGVEIIADMKQVFSLANPIMLFSNNYQQMDWCKGNVARAICPNISLKGKFQVQASAMVFKVCKPSIDFVKEWLLWCQMPGFIDDSEGEDNEPGFQEHRHDQAIITCLAYKYGYELHWWPASYNNGAFTYDKLHRTPNYPILFNHHRRRNYEW